MSERRFPNFLYSRGQEPDPRFSLANERTFLAWIRTSLALVAAGVALVAFELPIQPRLRFAAAVMFLLLGLLAAIQAWVGWLRTESALRADSPLPGPALAPVLTAGVVLALSLVTAGVVV